MMRYDISMSKEVQVIAGRMKQLCGDDQKRKLVQESYESGLSLNQFAKQRGLSPASLCQWRKKFPMQEFSQAGGDDSESLRTENDALKKEILKLKAYLGHKIYQFEGAQIA